MADLTALIIYFRSMEYMDAGSLDKLAVIPVPEPVLQRVTGSMVRGLKFLKDRLQIMHRGKALLRCHG